MEAGRKASAARHAARRTERGQSVPRAELSITQAEQRGYLVVTPMGYRPLRQPVLRQLVPIARPNGPAPADGWTPLENERAEQDVLNVIDLVTKEGTASIRHASFFTARIHPAQVRYIWARSTASVSRRW